VRSITGPGRVKASTKPIDRFLERPVSNNGAFLAYQALLYGSLA
jgi:hypothetical protein